MGCVLALLDMCWAELLSPTDGTLDALAPRPFRWRDDRRASARGSALFVRCAILNEIGDPAQLCR
eukprot:121042-Prymnesium_polylepis.1